MTTLFLRKTFPASRSAAVGGILLVLVAGVVHGAALARGAQAARAEQEAVAAMKTTPVAGDTTDAIPVATAGTAVRAPAARSSEPSAAPAPADTPYDLYTAAGMLAVGVVLLGVAAAVRRVTA